MSVEVVRDMLFWCTTLNYGVVLVWFVLFWMAHDWMQGLHGRWFRLSADRFDAIHYGGMAVYKIGILLFNLVPYVSLRIVS